jgi:hypothetical protein
MVIAISIMGSHEIGQSMWHNMEKVLTWWGLISWDPMIEIVTPHNAIFIMGSNNKITTPSNTICIVGSHDTNCPRGGHSIVKLKTMCNGKISTFYIKDHQNKSIFFHFFSRVDIHSIYYIVKISNKIWRFCFYIKHTVSN